MRLIACLLVLRGATIAWAGDLNEEVLDARIQLIGLRMRYGEKHPKIIEAETRIDVLSKEAPSVAPPEYLSAVKHKIVELRADEAVARLRYGSQHPKIIEMEEKLRFLREEEKKADAKPTPAPSM